MMQAVDHDPYAGMRRQTVASKSAKDAPVLRARRSTGLTWCQLTVTSECSIMSCPKECLGCFQHAAELTQNWQLVRCCEQALADVRVALHLMTARQLSLRDAAAPSRRIAHPVHELRSWEAGNLWTAFLVH